MNRRVPHRPSEKQQSLVLTALLFASGCTADVSQLRGWGADAAQDLAVADPISDGAAEKMLDVPSTFSEGDLDVALASDRFAEVEDDAGAVPDAGFAGGDAIGAGGSLGTGGAPGSGGIVGTGGVLVADAAVDTGGAPGSGGIVGTGGVLVADAAVDTGGAPGSGGVVGTGGSSGIALVKLSGAAFGTGPPANYNPAYAFDKVFDGDITTYDDDQTWSNGYAGLALGAPASVSVIRYHPRPNWNTRMVGGKFQCSTTSQTAGYMDLYTIPVEPPLAWVEIRLTSPMTCSYLRYLAPANGKTNIAEVEFWGPGQTGGPALTDAGAPLSNLSFNKPTMASSERSDDQAPKAANDGLLTTRFCSADATFPVWWMVDLGALFSIVQTDINSDDSALVYQYKVDISSDGATWVAAVDQTTNTTRTGGTLADSIAVQGRYVRFTITNIVGTGGPACFPEFQVWGYDTPVGNGTALTNLSQGLPSAAGFPQDPNKPPSYGNDGIMTTVFCSGSRAHPVWWEVDLGEMHSLAATEVSFEWGNASYQYVIEVSPDHATWTTVVDQSTNTTRYGTSLVDTFRTTGRYVRITIIGGGGWGCFFELSVWGN